MKHLRFSINLLLLCLVATGWSRESDSVDNGDTLTDPYIVSIERLTVDDMKLYDTLDVTVESFGRSLAGFLFKVGTTSSFAEIVEILPGEVADSCGWEFFRALQVNTIDQPELPPDLWRVTALAKLSADTTQPLCYGFDRPASLMRLVVSSAHMSRIPDTTAPIFFFWQDCRDNVISDAAGDHLFVSKRVFDYFPVDLPSEKDVFPTRFGAPHQCFNPNIKNAPRRLVEFHNGGVEFKLDLGHAAVDTVDIVDTTGAEPVEK